MKKILLAVALIASVSFAQAQVRSDADVQKQIAKAEADAQNPKKAEKFATWLKLGKVYVDAYNNPLANVVGGNRQQLDLVMGNDKAKGSEKVVLSDRRTYEKVTYAAKNLYFDEAGNLQLTEVTRPSAEGDLLWKALEAYKKAYELDLKQKKTKDISDAIETISKSYNTDAFTAYTLGNNALASELFEKSALASMTAPCPQSDTSALYFAGIMALESQQYPRAQEFFEKSMQMGYYSDGAVYANMYESLFSQKDTLAAKQCLETGFSAFPENAQILTNLINLYITINEDPNKLIDLLDKAKKELPDNASLYYVEGDIQVRLKNYDAAIAAYRKAGQVSADYEMGYYGEGVLWYNRALEIQEEANALPYSEYKKYDQLQEDLKVALKNCIEPFETCFAKTKNEAVRVNVADYLKRIYFIFRAESDEYKVAYEKYKEIVDNAK